MEKIQPNIGVDEVCPDKTKEQGTRTFHSELLMLVGIAFSSTTDMIYVQMAVQTVQNQPLRTEYGRLMAQSIIKELREKGHTTAADRLRNWYNEQIDQQ